MSELDNDLAEKDLFEEVWWPRAKQYPYVLSFDDMEVGAYLQIGEERLHFGLGKSGNSPCIEGVTWYEVEDKLVRTEAIISVYLGENGNIPPAHTGQVTEAYWRHGSFYGPCRWLRSPE